MNQHIDPTPSGIEKELSSRIVFECPTFEVEEVAVELFDASIAHRWHVLMQDAVMVVGVRDGKIILLREYRSASQKIEWRLPAGTVHDGEDPALAAIREFREETGLEPLDLQFAHTCRYPSSVIKQQSHCFFATKFRENPLDTGDKEEQLIKVQDVTPQELKKLLSEEEFSGSIGKALRIFLRDHPNFLK